jgi:hypothetical protein
MAIATGWKTEANVETLFGWLFSGAWAWILSKLGISPEEKLGRAAVTVDEDTKALQEVKKANEIENLNARISDDALRVQLGKSKRPD